MIDIIKMFVESTVNWVDKLEIDEWFFEKLRHDITKDISPNQAFRLIPDAVYLVLEQENKQLCIEAFELLLKIIRLSNTTEMPSMLSQNWSKLIDHILLFGGDYHRNKIDELKRWYRKES